MSFHCDLCDIDVSSESVLRDHKKGKRHQRLEKLKKEQWDLAERSIYITGMWPKTTADQLKQCFCQYGTVIKVILDREKGRYAIIEFQNKQEAQHVLQTAIWLMGKKLSVKPREVRPFQPHKKPIRKLPTPAAPTTDIAEPVNTDTESMEELLRQAQSVDHQMELLMQTLQLSMEEMKQRCQLLQQLEDIFSHCFPDCRVQQFGSSANSLGIHGCDMDLMLQPNLDSECTTWSDDGWTPRFPYLADLRAFKGSQVLSSPASLCKVPLHQFIQLISRILCHQGKGFSDIIAIPSARCPVVKFTHVETGLHCDITINNRIALHNTELIQFYQHLDKRVRPFLYTIRYWAKERQLAGNVRNGPRMTNYALTLMVLHFLQNTQPPVLPSVEQLKHLCDPCDQLILDGWDCSVCLDNDKVSPSTNTSSLQTLLAGFFEYYHQLVFTSHVICTNTASTISLPQFMEKVERDERSLLFKSGSISIQDPFVLDHNTTLNVNEKTRQLWVEELHTAHMKCQDVAYNHKSVAGPWGLPYLLADKVSSPMQQAALVKQVSAWPYYFDVTLKNLHLHGNLLQKHSSGGDLNDVWVRKVCRMLFHVLVDILHIECSILSSKVEAINSGQHSDTKHDVSADAGITDCNSSCSEVGNVKAPVSAAVSSACEVTSSDVSESISETEQNPKRPFTGDNGQVENKRSRMVREAGTENPTGKSVGVVDTHKTVSSGSPQESEEGKQNHCVGRGGSPTWLDKLLQRDKANGANSGQNVDSPVKGRDSHEAGIRTDLALDNQCENTATASSGQGDHREGNTSESSEKDQQMELLVHATCVCGNTLWSGRKKVHSELRQKHGDSFELERLVSQALLDRGQDQCRKAMSFSLAAQQTVSEGNMSVTIYCHPKDDPQFSCFFTFFRSYFIKIVDKYLANW